MNLHAAVEEWRALLGRDPVLTAAAAAQRFGRDTGGAVRHVPAALQIRDAAVLPEVMRIAGRHRVPVYPISTGRNWGYGTALPVRNDCVIIDLSGLQKILHFDAELGVVTLEPGVTQAMLAAYLEEHGHSFLVPVTGAGPHCSLLGNALERGYGITPIADHFGAVTDIEAVLADGSVYRTALSEIGDADLARLFKWGIGPYSAGLFTQSGFGIVTRITISLAPRPQAVKACFFRLRGEHMLGQGVGCIREVLRSLPGIVGGINLMNRHRVLAMSVPYPENQVGENGLILPSVIEQLGRQNSIAPWTGFATIYGTARIVGAAEREMKEALKGVASRVVFISPLAARRMARLSHWLPSRFAGRITKTAETLAGGLELVDGRPNETALRLAYWRSGAAGMTVPLDPARDGCGLIWYAPLVPMRAEVVAAYVAMVKAVTQAHRIEPLLTLTSISDKLFDSTVPLLFDTRDAAAVLRAKACYRQLIREGRELGCFPYRLGIDEMETVLSLPTASHRFHERLRRQLDPENLLSPGRYQ